MVVIPAAKIYSDDETRYEQKKLRRSNILEYIATFCNRERRHPIIGYRTPEQAGVDMTRATAA
jgi:hypothetical protein